MEKIVECIDLWKKAHAPWASSTVGWALFRWLLNERGTANPLKSLHIGTGHTEPAVRSSLQQFIKAGVIRIESRDGDRRYRLVRTTAKFDLAVQRFAAILYERAGIRPTT